MMIKYSCHQKLISDTKCVYPIKPSPVFFINLQGSVTRHDVEQCLWKMFRQIKPLACVCSLCICEWRVSVFQGNKTMTAYFETVKTKTTDYVKQKANLFLISFSHFVFFLFPFVKRMLSVLLLFPSCFGWCKQEVYCCQINPGVNTDVQTTSWWITVDTEEKFHLMIMRKALMIWAASI